jgi:hypothetical protein
MSPSVILESATPNTQFLEGQMGLPDLEAGRERRGGRRKQALSTSNR